MMFARNTRPIKTSGINIFENQLHTQETCLFADLPQLFSQSGDYCDSFRAYLVSVTCEPRMCESFHGTLHDSQELLSEVPLSETCGYEGGRIPILQQLMLKVRTS